MPDIASPSDFEAIPDGDSQSYTLTSDVDFTGVDFSSYSAPDDFSGEIDGGGNAITGIDWTIPAGSGVENVGVLNNVDGDVNLDDTAFRGCTITVENGANVGFWFGIAETNSTIGSSGVVFEDCEILHPSDADDDPFPYTSLYGETKEKITVSGLEVRNCTIQGAAAAPIYWAAENSLIEDVTIENLTLDAPYDEYGALLVGWTEPGTTVRDVTIRDSEFYGRQSYQGGLCSWSDQTTYENITMENVTVVAGETRIDGFKDKVGPNYFSAVGGVFGYASGDREGPSNEVYDSAFTDLTVRSYPRRSEYDNQESNGYIALMTAASADHYVDNVRVTGEVEANETPLVGGFAGWKYWYDDVSSEKEKPIIKNSTICCTFSDKGDNGVKRNGWFDEDRQASALFAGYFTRGTFEDNRDEKQFVNVKGYADFTGCSWPTGLFSTSDYEEDLAGFDLIGPAVAVMDQPAAAVDVAGDSDEGSAVFTYMENYSGYEADEGMFENTYYDGDLTEIGREGDPGTPLPTSELKGNDSLEGLDYESVWTVDGGYPRIQGQDACLDAGPTEVRAAEKAFVDGRPMAISDAPGSISINGGGS